MRVDPGASSKARFAVPVPRSAADSFIGCLILLEGTAAAFAGIGGRGRVAETVVIGAACIAAYLSGWRLGRWVSLFAAGAFLALEGHYGRLSHDRYWEEVLLALASGGAALAAAYLRLTVDTRDASVELALQRIEADRVSDEIDERLGAGARHLGTLTYELERARRHNHALSVLLVRPDELDEIAMRFGDDAASETFKLVADAIGRSLRATDIPLREPPFDFAVILPETTREDARMVAERIRLAVCDSRLEFGPGDVMDPTVSIGIAAFPQDATTNEQMTDSVRRALAGSVESGGNRTTLYSVPAGAPAGWGLARVRETP